MTQPKPTQAPAHPQTPEDTGAKAKGRGGGGGGAGKKGGRGGGQGGRQGGKGGPKQAQTPPEAQNTAPNPPPQGNAGPGQPPNPGAQKPQPPAAHPAPQTPPGQPAQPAPTPSPNPGAQQPQPPAAQPAPQTPPGQQAQPAPAPPPNPGAQKPQPPAAQPAPQTPPGQPAQAQQPKPPQPPAQPPAAPKPAQAQAAPPPPKPQPAPDKPTEIPPPVPKARGKRRHGMLALSFVVMVLGPILVSAWYLWTRAADQYASYVGFSVRTEEAGSSFESLIGISGLSGSSTTDTDILYKFLQSQELVATVDDALDLRRIWSKSDPEVDPVFAYHPPGTIEDLVDHWPRKVSIAYDSGSGLIDLRVLAFDPQEARAIAQLIFAESSERINVLSALAREDAIGYARDELDQAEARLRDARVALNSFRNRTQIVDPTIDTQGQMGLVNTLEAQLAEALIELDLLRENTRANDPRITQGELRIEVIERRIADERRKLGLGGGTSGEDSVFADLVGEFETLQVDLEFAQQSYVAALATFDAARNEARRQSRYLAAHVSPTLAERAEFPQRIYLLSLVGMFSFIFWAISALVAYSIRDRR